MRLTRFARKNILRSCIASIVHGSGKCAPPILRESRRLTQNPMGLFKWLRLDRESEPGSVTPPPNPGAQPPLPAVYFDEASDNARSAIESDIISIIDDPFAADLLWMRKGYRGWFEKLRPFQLLNHFPNERAVTDKGLLVEHLTAHSKNASRDEIAMHDFVQETFCLYLAEDRARFFAQLPATDTRDNLWILKPCASSRGRGIRILWQFDELRDAYAHPDRYDFQPETERYVIQRYIRNPLLLDGRKSEIRIYWLVASVNPLTVLMYREGTVRLNTSPFSLDDFDNTLIHVTNVFQQKSHPDYDPSAVLKWSFADWDIYLRDELKLVDGDWVEGFLKPRLRKMLKFVIEAARGSLSEYTGAGLPFALFGADIIFDDTLQPWLTEVQKGPGLSFDDPVKERVIPAMLQEVLNIVLEVRQRKRDGRDLKSLESVHHFEWVVREG